MLLAETLRLLTTASAAALAQPAAETPVFRHHADHVLGTSLDIAVASASPAEAYAAFAAARAEIARLDRILSGWRPDSELSRFNRGEVQALSPDLAAVVGACQDWRQRTGGAFDARCGGPLAPDGLAKGYVIDRAMQAARRAAPCARGLLIDIGGDLACWGDGPGGEGWAVGVAWPGAADNAPAAAMLRLKNQALAVSGPGPRDRLRDGRRVSHLIDPATGESAPRQQAAVVAPSAAEADALSTALAVMPAERGLALAEGLARFEALLFTPDGGQVATGGWSACQAALPAGFAVEVSYEVPRLRVTNYEKPYVAVWVTDMEKTPLKTLLIIGAKQDYQESNYVWWRRVGRKQPGTLERLARPTRAPGRYTVGWDGTDEGGKRMAPGRYIVNIEATREHGGHSHQVIEIELGEAPAQGQAPGDEELGAARASWVKRR